MDTPRYSPASRRLVIVAALLLSAACLPFLSSSQGTAESQDSAAKPAFVKWQPGDRIALVGNSLAERMQHDGWLETYFHAALPKHDLVFRNLGFSGDEIGGFTGQPDSNRRLRSAAFGSNDDWLRRVKANVIVACFGYNESFAGEAGIGDFKRQLGEFVKHVRTLQISRVVLCSPIAHENLVDANLPDGTDNNRRLALYARAMAEFAQDNNVPFVDLFTATRELYGKGKPLTINGIHLNDQGNERVAAAIVQSVVENVDPTTFDRTKVERIRKAVLDKNFYWFNRYRTTDGYSIYGGRADLAFVGGQTNRIVMQREMEVLDAMTANRDKVIWAAAQGRSLQADDSNTPEFIPVQTNKPGPLPGGKHVFLQGDDNIAKMTVAKGMKVNLFASEKEFPELVNPVQMSFDTQGRLWVAVWPTYPHWKPKEEMNDKLIILEDTNGDGKADKRTIFADNLHNPTGFELWNGGVIVAMAPDLLFLKDTNGDGKADVRQRIVGGLCSADTHHTVNSFVLDPGGALYMQEGTFHHTQVETPYGPPERCANAGVFRYDPRRQKFEVYVSFGFANPHGHVFDRWGQDIVVDGTGSNPYHAALFSGFLPYPQKHNRPPQVYQQRTRPCPGMEYLSSRHFPEEFQGNLLVGNVIGFQGILRYRVEDRGASYTATELEPILSSTDPNFRPSDMKMGPDGALYFIDWHNPIIGHMQHNLRDPSRDREHGRVYRVTYEGRELLKPVKIAGESIEKLLDLLKEPEDRTRYRARIELSARNSNDVAQATKKWLAELDPADVNYAHHLLEGLWVHQQHNKVDEGLLKQVLASPDFRARAAATRVLSNWRDQVPTSLELLKKLAADEHPRVRLEAIRAASFYTIPEAVEVVLISSEKPSDEYIDFLRGETMRALDPHVRKAIAENRPIKFTTAAGARYFLKNVNTADLLRMSRNQGVYLELLFRPNIRDEFRREALKGLGQLEDKDELTVLLNAIRLHDEASGGRESAEDETVMFDLVRVLTAYPQSQLARSRAELERLARSSKVSVTRQLGYVALIAADGNVERAWSLAGQAVPSLLDLVQAMPMIRNPGLRAELYPKIEPLLTGLPKALASGNQGESVLGRYVRIELPGRQRTLTLAEVEVMSAGRNVARQGKASQKNTSHGGEASRAIDGNKSGTYGDGGQTHTEEGTPNPWWQVDLGAEVPIDSILIYNRTDGNLGNRLNQFTVKVLDRDRKVLFERKNQPAPAARAALEVSGAAPERVVRRAAMNALVSVRGKEGEAFKSIARFVGSEADRQSAIQALLRIPTRDWPQDQIKPTLEVVLTSIRRVPTAERTAPAVLDALQLADGLAGQLPLADARVVRKELGELGVRILRLGTLTDQMLFDKDRLVVRAGKPVEVFFENTDIMPHNFALVQPGALEEIGNLAESTATQAGAFERHYIPTSNKVLAASRLLQPRESQRIAFTAPAKPGIYPYVCTYPGHWRRMYGAMYVVNDLDEYLADPEGYLSKNPLQAQDALLKFIRPKTEWKYEDLASSVETMLTQGGRSFSNGKQLFSVTSCVSCHKMGGLGVELGPDLTKLDPKMTPTEMLRHILEPSLKIDEKYQSYSFELNSGKFVTGMILEKTPQAIKVIENPLAKSEPIILKPGEIAEQSKVATSIMPKGLFDKLTREEILDLMAYLIAKGEEKHKLFQGGHDHGHGHGH